jgi:ABC-2 type transport system permease protein
MGRIFWALCKKELLEQWRTYRLLIAVVVFLILGMSGPIITSLTPDLVSNLGQGITIIVPPQTARDALNASLKNMLQLAPLVFILLAMGCVADERSRGTAVTVLTRPVPRPLFVLAKLCAYELTLLLSVALSAAGTYYYTALLFSALPLAAFGLLQLALWLLLSISLAFTILASTCFRNAIAAGGLAFLGTLALLLLPAFNSAITQALPSALFSADRLGRLLAGSAAPSDLLQPLLNGIGLVALLTAIACLIFQKQEL